MKMLEHYLTIAIRQLMKYKTQNLISIIGLSVGILCFSVCLYCSRFIGEVNRCFPHHNRIADIQLYNENGDPYSGIPATLIEALRQLHFDEVEAFTFTTYPRERNYNVETTEEGKELPYENLSVIETDSLFYPVFTPKVVQGSWEAAAHTPNAVILTNTLAQKMFGTSVSPIGKRMTLTHRLYTAPSSTPRTGGIVYTIQAVIEDIPLNTSLDFLSKIDMLVLNDSEGLIQFQGRGDMTGGYGFALLREGQTTTQLEADFRRMDLKHRMFQQENAVSAAPFGKLFWEKSAAPYFAGITMVVGILILLAGLLNFFHFLIGTFMNRKREYGIRKVSGGSTMQLFIQLFVQATVIALIAFLFTFCLIELLSPYLHFSLYRFTLIIEQNVLLVHVTEYVIGILCLCMLLCAFTAMRVRRSLVQENLRGNISGRHPQRTRNILLGIQFFICWIFLAFTVALYLQSEKTSSTLFHTLNKQEKEEILSINLGYTFLKNDEKLALIERLSQCPGVKDKLLADIAYTKGMSGSGMLTEKDNPKSMIDVNVMRISNNFFQFMNIPMLSGKTIETQEEMVADQNLVKRLQNDLLGTTLYNYTDGYTVRGICDNFVTSVYHSNQGFVFLPCNFNDYVGHCYLKCEPGRTDEVRQAVEKILKETLPVSITPDISTLQKDIYEMQPVENKLKSIILFFSLVSLIITLLGVYSAITLDTARRQKEVAIRKVNGAGTMQIANLFARLYVRILIISALAAFPIVYALQQMWQRMYTVFFDNGVFYWLSLFLGLSAITALTVAFRIRKAANINPAEIVKNEE